MAASSNHDYIVEHTLHAEEVFHWGGIGITNSVINTWVAVVVIILFSLVIKNKRKLVPRGLQNLFELILEKFVDLIQKSTGSRESAYKLLPLIFAFFVFILLNNWLGLLPGIGSIGKIIVEDGERIFIPFFRGGTADINTTVALAIVGIFASHVLGIMALGAWNYMNKFINIKALLEIPKKIMKEPTVIVVAPINVVIGLIEIVGEIAKVASLSFRLFGNIYAGEVLLASMAAVLAFGAPIPFIFLEVLIGVIQAFVFSILVLSYFAMATAHADH